MSHGAAAGSLAYFGVLRQVLFVPGCPFDIWPTRRARPPLLRSREVKAASELWYPIKEQPGLALVPMDGWYPTRPDSESVPEMPLPRQWFRLYGMSPENVTRNVTTLRNVTHPKCHQKASGFRLYGGAGE